MRFFALFASFSPYSRSTTNIQYYKKTQKPLYFLRFRALPFFPIKTDNPLILYIYLSTLLSYVIFQDLTLLTPLDKVIKWAKTLNTGPLKTFLLISYIVSKSSSFSERIVIIFQFCKKPPKLQKY